MLKTAVRRHRRHSEDGEGEFLWLVSLSDLMILLFVFFVVLFSFAAQKLTASDLKEAAAVLKGVSTKKRDIQEIESALRSAIEKGNLQDEIEFEKKRNSLTIHIKDKVLFQSGQFELNEEGRTLIGRLDETLSGIPEPFSLTIEGHTDDVPISTPTVSDNWDLSVKRSRSVLMALHLSPSLLARTSITGYADQKPRKTAGPGLPLDAVRAANRRVTLKIE